MARPKTYSDQDIIETAMLLIQQKKEVKAWRIREILGRGKLTSIQSDLDRLIADNEINIEVDETEVNNDVVTVDDTLNVDLPIEIFDAFKLVETELSASLLDLLQRLNNEAHKHHNQLTKTRLSQATKALEDAISAKAQAETEVIESENRVRLQIENVEELETIIESYEEREADLLATIERLKSDQRLSEKDNQLIKEQLDECELENNKLLSNIDDLNKQLEQKNLENLELIKINVKIETDLSNISSELNSKKEDNKILNQRVDDLIGSKAKLESELNNQQLENKKIIDLDVDKTNEINELKVINHELVSQNKQLNKDNHVLTTETNFKNERIAELNESLKDKDRQIDNFVQSIKSLTDNNHKQ